MLSNIKQINITHYLLLWSLIVLVELLMGVGIIAVPPYLLFIAVMGGIVCLLLIIDYFYAYLALVISVSIWEFSVLQGGRFGVYTWKESQLDFRPEHLMLILLFISWLISRTDKLIQKLDINTGINIPLGIFLIWILISILWSHSYSGTIRHYFRFFVGPLAFYLSFFIINSRERMDKVLAIWIIAGLFSAIVAIFQFGDSTQNLKSYALEVYREYRSTGFVNKDHLGDILNISIFLGFGALISGIENAKIRGLYYFAIGVMFIGILTTLARGTFIGFLGGTFALCIFYPKIFSKIFLFLLIILLIFFTYNIFTDFKLFEMFLNRFGVMFYAEWEEFSPKRIQVWDVSEDIIRTHPFILFFGVGFGNLEYVVAKYFPWSIKTSAHSLYLGLIAELGLIGLGIFVCLGLRIAYLVLKTIRSDAERRYKNIVLGSFAGIVSYLVHKLGGSSRLEDIYIWLALGILCAAIRLAGATKPSETFLLQRQNLN